MIRVECYSPQYLLVRVFTRASIAIAAMAACFVMAHTAAAQASEALIITPTPSPTPFTLMQDYTEGGGNAAGWLGGAAPGSGGTTQLAPAGLCMTVPGPGDNVVLWVSPDRLVELTESTVYKVRIHLSTDQTQTDAIPIFFLVYNNFNASEGVDDYGGVFWILDVDGGAEGIGRPQGRTVFDFFLAPNAITTPQWAGAFTPQADPVNDFRISYQIIDANSTILTDADSGTICVSSLEVTAILRSVLPSFTTVYNPPISSATHFAESFAEIGHGGAATIDEASHSARYQLLKVGDSFKTLGPYDPTQADLNSQLYPVAWTGDTLYRARLRVRAESSELDPLDCIAVAADTSTMELGGWQYTTRGLPGSPMDSVGSPKLATAEWESYFYSQNATASLTPNANRLRPKALFFSITAFAGDGTGGDAFIVEALEMDRFLSVP